jgi:hypothetical protein
MGARTRAHTPKCGGLPRGALTVRLSLTVSKGEFLKNQYFSRSPIFVKY